MPRSNELLSAHRGELFDLDGEHPRFDVPLRRVKKRRLTASVIPSGGRDHPQGPDQRQAAIRLCQPTRRSADDRKVMATALRGTKRKGGKVETLGICALLGVKPLTPHDLRRAAATLAGDLRFDDA